MTRKMTFKTLPIGSVFGKLTVIGIAEPSVRSDGSSQGMSLCRCECGVSRAIASSALRSNKYKSCGCLKEAVTHGFNASHRSTGTPTYNTWKSMWARIRNPSETNRLYYTSRGIGVCDRWKSFLNFLEDMGERPSTTHSIDRINNQGNYEPGNCRWATRQEQMDNTRRNRYVSLDGVTKTIAQWSRESGVHQAVIRSRLNRGIDARVAIWTPEGALKKCQKN